MQIDARAQNLIMVSIPFTTKPEAVGRFFRSLVQAIRYASAVDARIQFLKYPLEVETRKSLIPGKQPAFLIDYVEIFRRVLRLPLPRRFQWN